MWQRVVLTFLFAGLLTVVIQFFSFNLLVQGIIFAILGTGLSLSAWREETRHATLGKLFLGPLIFSAFLYTIADVDIAWVPALVFWLLTMYFGFSGVVTEDPLGVYTDRTEDR